MLCLCLCAIAAVELLDLLSFCKSTHARIYTYIFYTTLHWSRSVRLRVDMKTRNTSITVLLGGLGQEMLARRIAK